MNIKVPSTPRNPERGVVDAFGLFLEGREPGSVSMVGHATTIATNALFGQVDLELPTTALITTRGFRDVVEIGRQRRAEVYNLFFERPPMLVELPQVRGRGEGGPRGERPRPPERRRAQRSH